ncbi:hypothetical protein BD324DRAFT_608125 [Kockovaella imperatae]|uniref:RRM domain-containing protein n=1 Tax=Kockovaella imperatae TaxID=4999 RepID=A0A1Y1UJ04_9TREE|nr:hypothetical protein BD324DRAFT_608125 [Kockovaella imperatae]ORX37537.1 hypothetical protein BD324DRAFT_608125 [Kockovaella imperatae]
MTVSADEPVQLRLYGLGQSVTAQDITKAFSPAEILKIQVFPSSRGDTQWATVLLRGGADLDECLKLKSRLQSQGVSMIVANPEPAFYGQDIDNTGRNLRSVPLSQHPFPPLLESSRDLPPHFSPNLPTNLYILNLPIDMDPVQFHSLFEPFGAVEHSQLLSELDGMGRRRGFIMMETHTQASNVMMTLNGKWFSGSRIDITWALKQLKPNEIKRRGGGLLSNRVIHPPQIHHLDRDREAMADCSVVVDNLDALAFPSPTSISEIFSHFGPISRVTMIPGLTGSAIIKFATSQTARDVVAMGPMTIGTSAILFRPLVGSAGLSPTRFSPFPDPVTRDVQAHGATIGVTSGHHSLAPSRSFPKIDWSHGIKSNLNPATSAFVPSSYSQLRQVPATSSSPVSQADEDDLKNEEPLGNLLTSSLSDSQHSRTTRTDTTKASSADIQQHKTQNSTTHLSRAHEQGLKAIKAIWDRPEVWSESVAGKGEGR